MTVDPFTPWQQDPAELAAQTVGREDELRWLTTSCEAWLRGERPPWALVVGPRGAGKSHLLQVARSQLSDPSAVIWVGEDTATSADADTLWRSIWETDDPWGWTPKRERAPRPILFVEGFDRLLAALRPDDRWTLRHHLQESGAFLVATALDARFAAGAGEPFFGQLDTWSLAPLDLAQRRTLWLAVSGESLHEPVPLTLTRRESLIRLSGGSPRAVVTLADAVAGTRGDEVGTADAMLRAVQRLVTHYQQRFQDLPPLGQQMVQAIARAPRQLTGSELQGLVGATSSAASNAAKALEAAGVLVRSPDPDDLRVTRHELAEPLFRYWLEYRTLASWESTRAAWFGRLLGEVLTRDEIANVWWSSPDAEIRRAVMGSLEHGHLLRRAEAELWRCSESELPGILRRVAELDVKEWEIVSLVYGVIRRFPLPKHAFDPWRDHAMVAWCVDLQHAVAERGRAGLLSELYKLPESTLAGVAPRIVRAMLDRRGVADWPPLTVEEAAALSEVPFVRVMFASEGWTPGAPPLLRWADLAASVSPSAPDAHDLVHAAHERGDRAAFVRFADGTDVRLATCPRPELPAPDPEVFAQLCDRDNRQLGMGLTWAASLSILDERRFDHVVAGLSSDPPGAWLFHDAEEFVALLALAVRAPDRFERLAEALPEYPSVGRARQALAQLAERERGALHPELEAVWQAIHRPLADSR